MFTDELSPTPSRAWSAVSFVALTHTTERAEELKAENLALAIKLEEEKKARLEIERRLAPRFLSDHERLIVNRAIRPYSGHQIRVAAIGNPEAELYAEEFVKLFQASNWKVERISGALMGPAQYGLFLLTAKQPAEAAQALSSGLKAAGIKFKVQIDSRFEPEAVELRVGDKDLTETPAKSIR